jgi:hypothetical protein
MKISLYIILVVFLCLKNHKGCAIEKTKDTLNDNKVEFLNNLTSNYPFIINITETIDSINNEVNLYFDGFVAMGPPPPPSSHQMEICIINPDSLIVIHRALGNQKSLFEKLEAYFDFADNPSVNYPRIELEINGFGKTMVPEIKFILYISSGKKTTWKLWKTCYSVLDNIFLLYEKKRNAIANDYYNKEFSLLSHVEKESIIKYCPLDITIIFNLKCESVSSTPADEHEFFQKETMGW